MKKTVTLIIHGHRKLSDKTLETMELMSNEPTLTVKKELTKGPGDASEIADLVYFLSSDHSKYITGQNIHINGGMLMV